MKALIVEDDFTSRLLLQRILGPHAEVHVAVDGEEAVTAFRSAVEAGQSYDLVCLDIMMPKKDGKAALKEIREIEARKGILGLDGAKVIMVTAMSDSKTIMASFASQCESYIVKPIDKNKILKELRTLGLLKEKAS
ncbi:MAG: response regulator [Deltaproteobacteria bacterium]|nr:response regulator [Deltaproteobacteria bacterium]